jgi:energy-coupling factor transport system ATP-binding protein
MLKVRNLCYTYPDADKAALSGVSLCIQQGECICITGHSGCGKSTLLLALKGLLHDGDISGEILYGSGVSPEAAALSGMGLVFQNPETQLLCATVYDEVAFGPENLCLPREEIHCRIVESLSAVGLLEFGNRNVERFSEGQKQRLCIASVASMRPDIILLDEPTSQLDRRGKDDLCGVLRRLKDQGIAIIIAEHNIDPFTGLIDRFYRMDGGAIAEVSDAPPGLRPCRDSNHAAAGGRSGTAPVKAAIKAEGLFVSYPGSGPILNGVDFTVSDGELVHVLGENGSGKTTLLRVVAGVMEPDSGTLRVEGRKASEAAGALGSVLLLFQNPQRQLFEDTVNDEVAFTLKRMGLKREEIEDRVRYSLALCEAAQLSGRAPLTLSFGEQHRVALASVIAPDPRVLLLDEPFAGMDPAQRLRLLGILASLRTERGTAVVIASHDPLPDPEWADRTHVMEKGRIVCGEGGLP